MFLGDLTGTGIATRLKQRLIRDSLAGNLGASTITYAILGVPYYICSRMDPKTLFQLLRPLDYRA